MVCMAALLDMYQEICWWSCRSHRWVDDWDEHIYTLHIGKERKCAGDKCSQAFIWKWVTRRVIDADRDLSGLIVGLAGTLRYLSGD